MQNGKPNILYILADDLGWGDVRFHGSPIRTPNLDQLAETGVELDRHHVCPMCTPTRASILTGYYPGRFGKHATSPANLPVLPEKFPTLASMLKAGGYDTGLFGKWHLGSKAEWGPNHYGFDYSYGSLAGGVDPYNHCYKKGEYCVTWHRNHELIEERGHVTDLIADEAVRWIENRENPWFCYVPFTAVHIPVKAPFDWLELYEYEKYDSDPKRDRSFKKYAAYASQMDHAIGSLMESLERTGQRENTVIVFASDNGAISGTPLHASDMYPGWQEEYPRLGSNGPLRGQKCQLYDGGVRTPTIVNWHSQLDPGKRTQAVCATDWTPTLAHLAGCMPEKAGELDGKDVWDLIANGKESDHDRAMYWNFKEYDFGAYRNQWKLIAQRGFAPDQLELYNLDEDPQENRNLVHDKPDIRDQLLEVIHEERKKDDIHKRKDVNY